MFPHQTCMITILHGEQKVEFTQASNLPDHHIFKRRRKKKRFFYSKSNMILLSIYLKMFYLFRSDSGHMWIKIQIHSCRGYGKKVLFAKEKMKINHRTLYISYEWKLRCDWTLNLIFIKAFFYCFVNINYMCIDFICYAEGVKLCLLKLLPVQFPHHVIKINHSIAKQMKLLNGHSVNAHA